jgi:GT2 family glycosyltransferase
VNGSNPKVSAVIPNRNGATPRDGLTYLELILPSLREQTFEDFDVTVVDNGSTDGSVAYLRERWPDVEIVELAENTGFPAAVNRGIEASAGEYIALLNNDIELSPDWMERLVAELDGDPDLGFVTGKILRFAERDVVEQAGHDFYTCGLFAPRGLDEKDTGQYDHPAPTAIVSAAAAMYRRAAVERVGAFDEDYFLYCEDADLCLRMLLAGYRGLYVPAPEAYHVRGGTTGRGSDSTSFFLFRNALITLVKDLPASLLISSLPKILLYQYAQYRSAREAGVGATFRRAIGSFLRMLRGTLRKRRRVQGDRATSVSAYRAQLRTEYPLQTRFSRRPK